METTAFPNVDEVARYRDAPDAFPASDIFLVIKSQDQVERRARLVKALKNNRIGRIEQRPIAEGLVVQGRLQPGRPLDLAHVENAWKYREPRGLTIRSDGSRYVSEVDRILHVSVDGILLREYHVPGFGFLHGIELSPDERHLLVVSSGYDLILELDLATGAVNWDWSTWEHGFNPSLDGTYLARSRDAYEAYIAEGRRARLIDMQSGAYGLVTSARTNHPNSACYYPGKPRTVLATLGHSGEVIEIDTDSGQFRYVVRGLASMPHGILPHDNGWMVTNTLRGECWILDSDFEPCQKLDFSTLPGKAPAAANNEWLQCVVALGDGILGALDANRGIIMVDTGRRLRALVSVDQTWCMHFAVLNSHR